MKKDIFHDNGSDSTPVRQAAKPELLHFMVIKGRMPSKPGLLGIYYEKVIKKLTTLILAFILCFIL